ncbi:MAG: hypothetical protein M3O61_01360 [Gemmatimonadota bacterium]|nr:hypothetical protein [Gemmatimonadota bacterium]
MTKDSQPSITRATPRDYDTVVVFCGLQSIGLAAVYWAMRIGFDNPLAPVAKAVALALLIFTFPAIASRILSRIAKSDRAMEWWRSYPFLWLSGMALTAALGRLVQPTGLNVFPILGITGVAAFSVIFIRWLRRASIGRAAAIVVGCGAFSVWAAGVVWGLNYKNPLFYENFILTGNVHHDSLHITSFANMVRTYHVASIGIDGLVPVPYHWGTMWLFAQWSNLTGADLLDFYQLGYPVTMIPFFFGGMLAFAVAMRNRRKSPEAGENLTDDFRFWFVFLAACMGIMPISGLDAMGVWTSNLLISESYTVAVPCSLLLLATVVVFYDGLSTRAPGDAGRARSITDSLFVIVGIPLGIALLGYLKISSMALAFGLAVYALFRLRLYRRPLYVISGVLTTIVFAWTYTRVSLPAHREGLAAFDFLWGFVRPAWWPFFIVVHLFWSWLYIFVRLRSEGIGTLADLRDAASEKRILDVEVVALIALLGIAPGFVIHIDGGSAFYFSDVQRWLAVGFILSRTPELFAAALGETKPAAAKRRRKLMSRLDAISVRAVVIAFLLLPVLGSMISNSAVWPIRMARANAETRHALYPASIAAGIPLGLHGLPRLADRALLDEGLRRSPNFVVADTLRGLSAMPDSAQSRTALFIPQDQTVYWKSLTRRGACTFQSFVAPALSSLAMIDGMPAFGCPLIPYYGIGSFTPRSRSQLPEDSEPAALCRRAAAWRIDRVIMLRFEASQAISTTIECLPASRR